MKKSDLLVVEGKYDLFTFENPEILVSLFEKLNPVFDDFSTRGFKKDFKDFKFTELYPLVMDTIKEAELVNGLVGMEKKTLVINLIILMVDVFVPAPQPIKELLVNILHMVLPVLIDQLVALTKSMRHSGVFKKMVRKLKCC